MKPPRRERKQRQIHDSSQDAKITRARKPNWTLMEKQKLLEGLKSFGVHNLDRIKSQYLNHRNIEDIKGMIESIKTKFRARKPAVQKRAPIEVWLDEAEQLTKREPQDLSFLLSEVFSVFGNLEPHDMLPHGHAPNWNEIYLYFSAILRGSQPQTPTPSNAMVILSLIDSLVDDLRKIDSTKQRLLLQHKSFLLKKVKAAPNQKEAYIWLQKALDIDPFEANSLTEEADPSNPSEEADPSNPSEEADPSNPTEGADPSNPSEEADLSNPTEGADPSNPSEEADPSNPTEGADPSNENEWPLNDPPADDGPSTSKETSITNTEITGKAPSKRGRRGTKQPIEVTSPRQPQSKKIMFTINPFCVPVKYLKLDEKKATEQQRTYDLPNYDEGISTQDEEGT